jgi:uncharacterized BrkB/YihY/UPF0761 family membrane protein
MDTPNRSPVKNPIEAHSSEFLWQILVPVLVSVLIVLVIGIIVVAVSISGPGVDEKWAHISLIFLVLPFLFIGLILFAVLFFTSRLVSRFHHFLPPQFARLNSLINSVQQFSDDSCGKVTRPMITIKSIAAGAVRLLGLAFHRDQARRSKNV